VDDVFSGTTSAGRAFRFQMAALDPDSDGNLDQGQVTGSIELLFKIKDRASEFHAFPFTCQSIY
jgi:hypothetical protein